MTSFLAFSGWQENTLYYLNAGILLEEWIATQPLLYFFSE
jgi:hypothetical protein